MVNERKKRHRIVSGMSQLELAFMTEDPSVIENPFVRLAYTITGARISRRARRL
ncbi:MAG: hypothetical protein AB9873_12205 [Syntrophobacteraceae bacterium]